MSNDICLGPVGQGGEGGGGVLRGRGREVIRIRVTNSHRPHHVAHVSKFRTSRRGP